MRTIKDFLLHGHIFYGEINIQYSIFNIQYSIFNIQYSILNIQYWIFNIEYSIFNIQYSIFNIQYSTFNILWLFLIYQNSPNWTAFDDYCLHDFTIYSLCEEQNITVAKVLIYLDSYFVFDIQWILYWMLVWNVTVRLTLHEYGEPTVM